MIEINIGALVVLLGIPTAATGFCFWMLEHRIQKREKQKEAEEAKRQKEAAARERAREDLQIITIQGTSAAIALAALYGRALFTVTNSFYEGWGLPVTESLSFGRVPLVARNTSLTEAVEKLSLADANAADHE